MPNPHKGEVAFEVEDRVLILVFDWDALAKLKDTLSGGPDWSKRLLAGLQSWDPVLMRSALALGLAARQPGLDCAAVEAELSLAEAVMLITRALSLALFGDPDLDAALGKQKEGERPTRPAATGSKTPSSPLAGPASTPSNSGG